MELSLWDTAGQERFHSLGPIYYRDAAAALLVFDITDIDSFERVKAWVKELRQMVSGVLLRPLRPWTHLIFIRLDCVLQSERAPVMMLWQVGDQRRGAEFSGVRLKAPAYSQYISVCWLSNSLTLSL